MDLVVVPCLAGVLFFFPWSWLCGANCAEALALHYFPGGTRAEGKPWGRALREAFRGPSLKSVSQVFQCCY